MDKTGRRQRMLVLMTIKVEIIWVINQVFQTVLIGATRRIQDKAANSLLKNVNVVSNTMLWEVLSRHIRFIQYQVGIIIHQQTREQQFNLNLNLKLHLLLIFHHRHLDAVLMTIFAFQPTLLKKSKLLNKNLYLQHSEKKLPPRNKSWFFYEFIKHISRI